MRRYTVTWLKGAQGHLAQIWVDATDRQAVTEAANAIDRLLAVDPTAQGEEVSEGLRRLSVPPLHVLFSVREPDRLVEVATVRTDAPPAGQQGNGKVQPTD